RCRGAQEGARRARDQGQRGRLKEDMTPTGKGGQAQAQGGGSIIEEILAETKITPKDEGYDLAKRGVEAFISVLLEPQHKGHDRLYGRIRHLRREAVRGGHRELRVRARVARRAAAP